MPNCCVVFLTGCLQNLCSGIGLKLCFPKTVNKSQVVRERIPDIDSPTPAKPDQKCIPDIKHIILLKLTQESGDYKASAALVGMDPKYASKTFNKFINIG
ncbi:hypothetical protein DSO57_1020491 [Entomophthora muscae]|uniref:Uncharacterized protein n=1 Tax=Entomophthora muscae TaxID=34485 RepID=A0ACC2UQC4_9FUNG|nr:hypothetical protein DSO57_1020491 [Entomophthora muscae]